MPETKGVVAERPTLDLEAAIKIDTAMALVRQVDPDADPKNWRPFIGATSLKAKNFDLLLKNLGACLDGSKKLEYSPDGVPAFVGV